MSKIKKRYLIPSILLLIIFILLFFLSSIAKSYINSHGEELAGRKIVLKQLHINYFKTKVTADDFLMYEDNKVDTFVSFHKLIINFNPWKLIDKEFAFDKIQIQNPHVNIEKDGDKFNFSSLLAKTDSTKTKEIKEPKNNPEDTITNNIKYSIKDFKLLGGVFKYEDKKINNILQMNNLNIKLPEFAWNSRSSNMGLRFSFGEKGMVKIKTQVSQYKKTYNVDFQTQNIQLDAFTSYLKDFLNIDKLKGLLQTDIHIQGSYDDVSNINVKGQLNLNDIHILDKKQQELFSASSIKTLINNIDLKKNSYSIANVDVNNPKINAVLDKEGSNFEYFIAPLMEEDTTTNKTIQAKNTQKTDRLKVDSTQNITPPTFNLNRLSVNDGLIYFIDNTLNRPFKYKVQNININAKDITSTSSAIPIDVNMKFLNDGIFIGKAIIDPNEVLNVSFDGNLSKLDLHSFSPYTEYYLGYPINSGQFNYKCKVKMTPKHLKNNNNIFIKRIRFGGGIKNSTATKIPLKLALIVLEDANNNTKMNIPISGNPSDPSFKLGKVVVTTFVKFMIKAASSPFGMLGKMIGISSKKLQHIPFDYTQDSLAFKQKEILDKVASILSKKKNLKFTFRQDLPMDKEIALLAEKEVKKQYISKELNEEGKTWHSVGNNNEDFINYLNRISPKTTSLKVKNRFIEIIGKEKIKADFETLFKLRNNLLIQYLIKDEKCDPESVKCSDIDFDNMSNDLKTPEFKVSVSAK